MDMEKRLRRKLRVRAGFTLAETLMAVLILMMVTSIVAAGIPAAKNAYENVVLKTNAEVLLSTAISSLRNELGTARDVDLSDDTTVTYYHEVRESKSKIFLDSTQEKEGIQFQRYAPDPDLNNQGDSPTRLVTKAASDKLYVTYTKIVSNGDGTYTFKGLCVKKDDIPITDDELDIVIRVMSETPA